jgi:uncharacterized protein YbbC (DUF1343 family)
MRVRIGLESLLDEGWAELEGVRVGLVAGAASVDTELNSSVERLHDRAGSRLSALFGAEHGLRGEAQAGVDLTGYTDDRTGLPVHSLYGATRRPLPEMLDGVDALLFDLQDGGLRFYTYVSTLAYVMQAASEQGKRMVVLDRPVFLNGTTVEGGVLDPAYSSFVGVYPIPIRYGMTAGEMARLFNEAFGIGCDLTVIEMRGWRRGMWIDETGLPFVPPSPNLPTLSALTVYPGTCLIEGTNLSEGRGTTKPFEYVGAPFVDGFGLAKALNSLDLPGVRFREVHFVPTFGKHCGEPCGGVHLYVTDRDAFRPVETGLHLISLVRRRHPEHFRLREPWTEGGRHPLDLLTGGAQVQHWLESDGQVSDLLHSWKEELAGFEELRREYLIYPV